MSKKRASLTTSSDAGKKFSKEQREATAAGSQLVAALEAEKEARAKLEKTVEEDTHIIATMDTELEETKRVQAEQAELIERLRSVAKESRVGKDEVEHLLGIERADHAELKSKKDVGDADPEVLVILQGIIKPLPNCDTSEGGVMHTQCKRGEPCLFRRARQILRAQGMDIR